MALRAGRAAVEGFADFAGERGGAERLLQEGHVRFEDAVADNGLVGVARHEQHVDRGARVEQQVGELRPLMRGMTRSVRSRWMRPSCRCATAMASSPSVSFEDGVAARAEHEARERAHGSSVFDEQDRLVSSGRLRCFDQRIGRREPSRSLRGGLDAKRRARSPPRGRFDDGGEDGGPPRAFAADPQARGTLGEDPPEFEAFVREEEERPSAPGGGAGRQPRRLRLPGALPAPRPARRADQGRPRLAARGAPPGGAKH